MFPPFPPPSRVPAGAPAPPVLINIEDDKAAFRRRCHGDDQPQGKNLKVSLHKDSISIAKQGPGCHREISCVQIRLQCRVARNGDR